MPRAVWNGAVLAESDTFEMVEGNYYFPPKSLNREYFKKNDQRTTCLWKGSASYYDVEVNGKINRSAAWYYPAPSRAARNIKGYVAFWNGVKIEKLEGEKGSSGESLVGAIKRLFTG